METSLCIAGSAALCVFLKVHRGAGIDPRELPVAGIVDGVSRD